MILLLCYAILQRDSILDLLKVIQVRAKLIFVAGIFFVLSFFTPQNGFAKDLCVQLKWYHQSQFAGFYLAKEEGLYKSLGLDVRFFEGGPDIDWQKRMKDINCPVGITNAYEVVIAKSRGVPVKAIAAVAQVSPVVWFALEESGIKGPRQFHGKKIALVPTGKIHFMGMLEKVGVRLDEVKIMPFSVDMSPMYRGEVDVWSGYHTNLVTKAEQEGYDVNIIHPLNYGIQIYDDVIYAREDLINKSPVIVREFLRASLKGWMNAIKHPERAITHTLKYTRNENREHEMRLFQRTMPYVHTGEVLIGWMEKSIWDEICFLTEKVGLINSRIASEEVYTDTFLHDIYPEEQP